VSSIVQQVIEEIGKTIRHAIEEPTRVFSLVVLMTTATVVGICWLLVVLVLRHY
jgi:hypothetical protein